MLGAKVSIRYRLHDDPGGHPFSEAVGVVMAVDKQSDDATVTIMTKRGEVSVAIDDVLAMKVFPTT